MLNPIDLDTSTPRPWYLVERRFCGRGSTLRWYRRECTLLDEICHRKDMPYTISHQINCSIRDAFEKLICWRWLCLQGPEIAPGNPAEAEIEALAAAMYYLQYF